MNKVKGKALALVSAGLFAGGISGCHEATQEKIAQPKAARVELKSIVQPSLNSLGRLAINLRKQSPNNVIKIYNRKTKTVEILARNISKDPETSVLSTVDFIVKYGVEKGTKKPDQENVVSAEIYSKDEDRYRSKSIAFTLDSKAPKQDEVKDNYSAAYAQYGENSLNPEEAPEDDDTIVLSTDDEELYTNSSKKEGLPTAATTAEYICGDTPMELARILMKEAAEDDQIYELPDTLDQPSDLSLKNDPVIS